MGVGEVEEIGFRLGQSTHTMPHAVNAFDDPRGMKAIAHVEDNAAVGRTAPLPWEQFKRMFSAA